AALQRTFGAAACECARNGSRPDHPLHPAYVPKDQAAAARLAETRNARRRQHDGSYRFDVVDRTPVLAAAYGPYHVEIVDRKPGLRRLPGDRRGRDRPARSPLRTAPPGN